MKNNNLPDERVVYLALKNVFKGENAKVRQLKAVRKLVSKSQNDTDVSDIIKAHNIDIVCNTARALLAEEIFESTLKAKIRFPEVFDVSPAQSAEREASEAEAAISEANAIKGAVQRYADEVQDPISRADVAETESVETYHEPKPPAVKSTHAVPSLFPIYLPLRTQHRILTKVQSILEDACFDFGQRVMPEVLKKNQWACSEAAELNLWAVEFLQYQGKLFDKTVDVGMPLAKLFRSIADIRHTAVHRIYISAKGLEHFLLNAESLVTLLGDATRLKSLADLRRTVQQAIEELEGNKHVLSSKLTETLKRIAAQRAELDRAEEAAITDMMREDGEYQAFAGKNLEEIAVFSEVHTLVGSSRKDETSSNADDADTMDYDSSRSS